MRRGGGNMPQAKKSSIPWTPILVGSALVLGGWWLYSQSAQGEGIDPENQALIDALRYKTKNSNEYLDLIHAGGRTPTDQEYAIYEMMHQDIYTEELSLNYRYMEQYRQALTEFYRTLGMWVILPSIIGLIGIGGLIYWWRKNHPGGGPPTCPKCGQTFATPDQLQSHVKSFHGVSTSNIQQADAAWQSLPFYVTSSVVITGQIYSAPDSMQLWDFNTLIEGLGGMGFTLGAGMGTAAALANTRLILMLCLI
jgi:hypothetical protein